MKVRGTLLPTEVVERVLGTLRSSQISDRSLARAIVVNLGYEGWLGRCGRSWGLAAFHPDVRSGREHRHFCRHFVQHPGRCTCSVPGCRSWTGRLR